MSYNIEAKLHVLKNGGERVTSAFGNRTIYINGAYNTNFHSGIDLVQRSTGTDYIVAAARGIVTDTRNTISGFSETYSAGNYVKLKHADGYTTEYYHMAKGSVCVKPGDTVDKGQVIGYMGTTGWSTGNHLHFGIRINGTAVDPEPYLLGTKPIPAADILGSPVSRDTSRRQAEVLIPDLRARKRPEVNDAVVMGFIKPGTYNIYEERDMTHEASNGYLWFRVGTELWIAVKSDWVKILEADETSEPAQQTDPTSDNSVLIAALNQIQNIAAKAVGGNSA